MLHTDFQSYFFLRTSKILKNGGAPIYLRIQYAGKRKDISTKLNCPPNKWNSELKLINASSKEDHAVNGQLLQWKEKLEEAITQLQYHKAEFDLDDIRDFLQGKRLVDGTLEFFELRLTEIAAELGKGYSKSTHTNYRTTLKHLRCFIKMKYRKSDFLLKAVNYDFLRGFLAHLKTEADCQTNTANKYMRGLRAVLYEAKKRGLIERNPFESYQLKYDRSERGSLSEQELDLIIQKDFHIERLRQVRDIFIFSCFTGLAYADIKGLKQEHLIKRKDKLWIVKPRQKSGVDSMVPLMPIAERILERYKGEGKNDQLTRGSQQPKSKRLLERNSGPRGSG